MAEGITEKEFDKLWERLNLRGPIGFEEYSAIRSKVSERSRKMLDDMILGIKHYESKDVVEMLFSERRKGEGKEVF